MNEFHIQFDPPLPVVPRTDASIAPDEVEWKRVLAALPQEFDTRYVIGDTLVAYYPTAIMNVFFDLCGELNLFSAREPHVMCLCGYPVLDLSFVGENAYFFHSHELSLGDARKPIAGAFEVSDVERAFKSALDQVWSVIKSVEWRPFEPVLPTLPEWQLCGAPAIS
jgi:hypothetical protein